MGAIFAIFFVYFIFILAVGVIAVISMWKIFEKAGQPGWGVFIPIYNLILMTRIAGRSAGYAFLLFIPFLNFIIYIILCMDIARNFGKDGGFGLGMVFLPFIFYPMLAFGDAQYQGVNPNTQAYNYTANARPTTMNVADEIAKLDKLFRDGIITFEEFERRKQQLLNS